MRLDIYKTIGITSIISQITQLRRLMVNPKRVNLEYLKIYNEIPTFLFLAVRHLFFGGMKPSIENQKVLIVNATTLIGEFISSTPAISSYIQHHSNLKVDLLVAPIMIPLAQKIRGVNTVISVDSKDSGSLVYGEVFAIRMDTVAYNFLRNIRIRNLHTSGKYFLSYLFHLLWCVYRRKTPTQWWEINFRMMHETPRSIGFDEIFLFSESEMQSVLEMKEFCTNKKRIIIHTGTDWIMKQWENGKWIEFLIQLQGCADATIIFIGAKQDIFDHKRISSYLGFETRSLIGKLNLAELAIVLRESDFFIGIDSGPGNIAHLCDTPSIHIMGPGPHMYRPMDETRHIIIDKTRGRGLLEMFFSKNHGCIQLISPSEVFAQFEKIKDL